MNKTHPFGEATLIQTLSYQIIRMYCLEQDFISRRQGRKGGQGMGTERQKFQSLPRRRSVTVSVHTIPSRVESVSVLLSSVG